MIEALAVYYPMNEWWCSSS